MFEPSSIMIAAIACAFGMTMAWWHQRRKLRLACADPGSARRSVSAVSELYDRFQAERDSRAEEQVLARRIAEERATRFERMFTSFDDPILVLDRHGEVVEANPAALAIAGLDPEQCVVDAVHPRDLSTMISNQVAAKEIHALSRNVVERGSDDFRRSVFELTDDGAEPSTRAFEAVIRTLDGNGRSLVVLHETTREREMARLKSEFVAKASHELRTPLSSIRASLEMLSDGELQDLDQRTEFLGIAMEETDRLAKLVNDMLDISCIEAGVARPRMRCVDVGALAKDVVDGLRAAAERKSVDLRLHVESGLVVDGDPEMLATVIGNLVGNGLKYVPEGERITVTVDAEDLTRSVVVTVTDTGLGIPPEDIDRVFDKFYRIKRYERTARGTGLGLNLCRNIVEQVHQGRIGVDSRLGEGARFWFSVPASHPASVVA
ncbi:MAG: ATP-binding protein [Planctomycetota bacterium]|nr:ATP-binding protein [Planctomycetota bacterium]MDA1025274.1 ATP-binding protein [Planctomycetota bacterium]